MLSITIEFDFSLFRADCWLFRLSSYREGTNLQLFDEVTLIIIIIIIIIYIYIAQTSI